MIYSPDPVFDGSKLQERIETVSRGRRKQSDDDIDILKANLKTQRATKAAIEVLWGPTFEQHVGWKKAIVQITKLLEE